MSTTSRTNPAYAHLAYQAAIAEQAIEDLLEKYVGNEVSSPAEEIECGSVVHGDMVVPQDEVLHFVNLLKTHKAQIDKELSRFEFVRKDDGQDLSHSALRPGVNGSPERQLEPQAAPSPGKASKEERKRRGRRGSRGRKRRENVG